MSMTAPSTTTTTHTTAAAPYVPLTGLKYVPDLPALGISEMMEYLSAYMNKSDADLRSKMADMKNDNDKSNALHGIVERLNTIKGRADGDGNITNPSDVKEIQDLVEKNPALMAGLSDSARKALASLSGSASSQCTAHALFIGGTDKHLPLGSTRASDGSIVSPTGDTLIPAPDSFNYSVEESYVVKKEDVDNTIKALAEETSAMSSGNELKMIQLQSAISARGNLLSMVSNMVKSFDDNAKSIVGNMR